MDPTSDSYFAAAGGPTGLTAGLAELEEMRQRLYGPSRNNRTLIPQTGAAKYWYVDPSAGRQNFNPMEYYDNQGHNELEMKNLGLLPANTPIILKRNVLGKAPRLADRDELNDMLNQSPETQFLGKQKPTPTPTPAPRLYPTSFFA